MRKIWIPACLLTVIAFLGMGVSSCNMNDATIQIVSQSAGTAAAITWIAYDNPDSEIKAIVKTILDFITESATNVQAGASYTEVLYPQVENFISDGQVPDKYVPFVQAGALAALNGIDFLFISYPSWKEKQDIGIKVVSSFVNGAKIGLSLSDKDLMVVQAKRMNAQRKMIYK